MEIVDDSKLVQLAAPQAIELFPVFQRAASLTPLLLLLAILPGLYALEYRSLDDNAALWGLHSLEQLSSDDVNLLDIDEQSIEMPTLQWQPPLGPWLTTWTMSWLGSANWISLVIWSYLETIGLITLSYYLCRRLVGPRFAFWTVLLLACHPVILRQVQDPAQHSLAILAAVATFWGFVAHRQDEESLVSTRLLISGISLGLCLLSGGPMSLIVVAALLVHVLGLRGESLKPGRIPISQRRRIWTGWPALQSLLVVVLTAFAVGGWWVLMKSWQSGAEFWGGWLTGSDPSSIATGTGSRPQEVSLLSWSALGRFMQLHGGVFGLSALGVYCGCRELIRTSNEVRRRRMQFLVAWAGAAIIIWLILLRNSSVMPHVLRLWEGFLLLPCIAFAALAIDEISCRRVPLRVAIFVSCVSFAVVPIGPALLSSEHLPILRTFALVLVVVGSLLLADRVLDLFGIETAKRHRIMLSSLVIAQLIVNAGVGLVSARVKSADDRMLASCRAELATITDVTTCTLIKEAEPPLNLWFLLRSLWPQAKIHAVDSWDEALSHTLGEHQQVPEKVLVIDWSSREIRPANIQVEGLQVDSIGRAQFFRGRQVRAYQLIPDP